MTASEAEVGAKPSGPSEKERHEMWGRNSSKGGVVGVGWAPEWQNRVWRTSGAPVVLFAALLPSLSSSVCCSAVVNAVMSVGQVWTPSQRTAELRRALDSELFVLDLFPSTLKVSPTLLSPLYPILKIRSMVSLLHGRHYTKHLINVILFSPHKKPCQGDSLLCFTDASTEVQRDSTGT